MTQGQRLKNLIQQKETNNTRLAETTGVPRVTISRIANDKQGMGDDVARKLATGLGVSLATLVLPKEEDVVSRGGLDRRLQAVEAEAQWLRKQLVMVAQSLGLQLAPREDEPPARSDGGLP